MIFTEVKIAWKSFLLTFREHSVDIVNFKEQKNEVINKRVAGIVWKSKNMLIFFKKIENKYLKDKKYWKERDLSHYTGQYRDAVHSICNSKYSIPKKIHIAFYNGSNYGYHFIIKELAEEFKKQFACLGENTEKYITFTVPIEKEVKWIDKNREEITKTYLTYYNLLIVEYLWQAHCQTLSILFPKEFIKWNVNTDTMIKK